MRERVARVCTAAVCVAVGGLAWEGGWSNEQRRFLRIDDKRLAGAATALYGASDAPTHIATRNGLRHANELRHMLVCMYMRYARIRMYISIYVLICIYAFRATSGTPWQLWRGNHDMSLCGGAAHLRPHLRRCSRNF
jgi:hypothetical protein